MLPSPASAPLRTVVFLLLLPLALLCCASSARAVPVTVTGGALTAPAGSGNFQIFLTAPGFRFGTLDLAAPLPQLCGLCRPGDQFGGIVPVRTSNSAIASVLTYDGVTYAFNYATIIDDDFVITLPPLAVPADLGPVVSPFSFSGTLFVTPFDGSGPLTFELSGQGAVTFTFTPNAGGGSTLGRADFAFAPAAAVPEPTTVLLLATGLGGVAAGARRRRKGRTEQA